MLIILEGPDGVGKSTVAKELSSRIGYPVVNATATPFDGTQTVNESQWEDAGVLGALIATGADAILDRSFPSEYAYGQAYDRSVNWDRVREMDVTVSKAEHMAVLFTLPVGTNFIDFLGEREVRDIDAESWLKAYRGYEDFVSGSRLSWHLIPARMTTSIQCMHIIEQLNRRRPSKDDTYMALARTVAKRSTCLSKHVGAVLLSAEGHVIATGYNGSPTGFPHQDRCDRIMTGQGSGASLDMCNDVHSEENCLVQAALNGSSPKGGTIYTTASPCHRCMRMLINAQVKRVIYGERYADTRAFDMAEQGRIRMKQA